MKHLLFILLFPVVALSQSESQPPTFLMPGETVTATDTAWLIGMGRLRRYEKAVDIIEKSTNPTEIFAAYEEALKASGEKFDRLLKLHTSTTGEIKLGIEKSSEVNRDAIARLRSLAQQNADLLDLAHETRKDVKKLGRRQFWNKLGILSMGVVAGGVAVFVLTN